MKKVYFLGFIVSIFSFGYFINSCDRVENPVIPALEIDTTLFPGNWEDYPFPVFGPNSNPFRNVLLEDYTGHKCPNCPAAATIASTIEANNPGRVFVVSIHAAPGDPFQLPSTPGDGDYPKYAIDFTTDAGDLYVEDLNGFIGNPAATINREIDNPEGGHFSHVTSSWSTKVSDQLSANDLKINLQQEINYYPSTNGLFVHVQAEAMEQISANISIVSYFIQKEVDAAQKDGSTTIEHYHHHNVLRGTISPIYGEPIFSSANTGETFQVDFSYEVPQDTLNIDSNIRVISYAMDLDTYKIYHVVQSDVIP